MGSFKQSIPLDERKNEVKKIFEEYPERLPVIVERGKDSPSLSDLDKKKYLVPKDLTVGQFLYVIRKRLEIGAKQSIYIFVNNVLPLATTTVRTLYHKYINTNDHLLHVFCEKENTFGGGRSA